ncbi:MAG: threonylcarbamoyl-AMP synthase [Desulfobacteraceae bacterium]|nr:threonylcarbamoyl-AMP synthase [Desulfobacteraceae bacterium]
MTGDTPLRKIDPTAPDAETIQEAAGTVHAGGIVVFPTTGLYGLAADAMDAAAVDRIYRVKRRSKDKPLSVLIADSSSLSFVAATVPPAARRIVDAFWPGSVTVVLEARSAIPGNLTAGRGKIGVRMPNHPVALALVRAVGGIITATSANVSGMPGIARIEDLDVHLAAEVDLVLDAGPLEGGAGSTVVDATQSPPVVLREGAVRKKEIRRAAGT